MFNVTETWSYSLINLVWGGASGQLFRHITAVTRIQTKTIIKLCTSLFVSQPLQTQDISDQQDKVGSVSLYSEQQGQLYSPV